MKPNPDNQLRKRIADALLADDPSGFSDREVERALEEARSSGEAVDLTDIEIGRILLKMRHELPVGERLPHGDSPAPSPAMPTASGESAPKVTGDATAEPAIKNIVERPRSWWKSATAKSAIAALFVVGLGFVALQQMEKLQDPAAEEGFGDVTSNGSTSPVVSEVDRVRDLKSGEARNGNAALGTGHLALSNEPKKFFAITFDTGPLEKKRVELDDGSVLFVNANSHGQIDNTRRVSLEKGEIFLEVAPRSEEDKNLLPGGATFTVATPAGDVTALGTKFGVRSTPSGTGVLVTQGTVRAAGVKTPLKAGQEMLPGPRHPVSPSRRPSEALHWLRELDTEANPPAAPASAFLGGVLIAYDGNGRERKVELKSSRTDVVIENGFARTTIDQTYASSLTSPVEAVFYFPVPPDAAVTRFATSAGKRMVEADIVPREPARVAYRNAASAGGRPGLMEWQDPSTFSMRIFPLEPGANKRIQLTFTRRLNTDYGRTQFRLAGVGDAQFVGHWSAKFRVTGGARLLWDSSSHKFRATAEGPDLVLESADRSGVAHRDLVVNIYDRGRQAPGANPPGTPNFSTFDGPGGRYLLVRQTPDLGKGRVAERRDWIFLYETSADRNVLEAKTAAGAIRGILDHVGSGDTFAVVSVGTRVKSYGGGGFTSVTPGHLAGASTFLNSLPRLGALNVASGFAEASRLAQLAKNPIIVHLGSGIPILGERNTVSLLNQLPDVPYVGVGIGPRWNRPLMKAAAGKSGGFFTQMNPDEPARWRAFDLLSTLNSPRLVGVEVSAPNTGFRFHPFREALAHGEELCAIAKLPARTPVPSQIALHGLVDGEEWHQVIDVSSPKPGGRYLSDLWARLEIDRLLAYGGGRDQITSVSLTHHVLSPFTSFLTTPDVLRIAVEREKKAEEDSEAVDEMVAVAGKPESLDVAKTTREEGAKEKSELLPRPSRTAESPGPGEVTGGAPVPAKIPTEGAPTPPSSPRIPGIASAPRGPQEGVESGSATPSKPSSEHLSSAVAGGGSAGTLPVAPRVRGSEPEATGDVEAEVAAAPEPTVTPSPQNHEGNSERPTPTSPGSEEGGDGGSVTGKKLDGVDAEHAGVTESETKPLVRRSVKADGKLDALADSDPQSKPMEKGANSGMGRAKRESTAGSNGDKSDARLEVGVLSKSRDLPRSIQQLQWDEFSEAEESLSEIGDNLSRNEEESEKQTDYGPIVPNRSADGKSEWELAGELKARELSYHQPLGPDIYGFLGGRARFFGTPKSSENSNMDAPELVAAAAESPSISVDAPPSKDPSELNELSPPAPSDSKPAAPFNGAGIRGADREDVEPETDQSFGAPDPEQPTIRQSGGAGGSEPAPAVGLHKRKVHPSGNSRSGPRTIAPPMAPSELGGAEAKLQRPDSNLQEFYRYWNALANLSASDGQSKDRSQVPSDQFGQANVEDPLDFTIEAATKNASGDDALAILSLAARARRDDAGAQQKLAEAFREIESETPAVRYASKYEGARALLRSGDAKGSQSVFSNLYESLVDAGTVPAFDDDFPRAFALSDDLAGFHRIVRKAVDTFLAEDRFGDAVGVAWQCEQTGHRDLADEILERIKESVPRGKMAPVATAALQIFGTSEDDARTAEVVGLLIRNGSGIVDSALLRRAAEIAHGAGKRSLALDWLERALHLDYGDNRGYQPVMFSGQTLKGAGADRDLAGNRTSDSKPFNIGELRRDYSQLFGLFREHAAAMKTLEVSSPRNFSQRVGAAAENWRALDPDPAAACAPAASVLSLLGEDELAWDYATTPLALSPDDADAWKSLAKQFGNKGLSQHAAEAEEAAEAAGEDEFDQ